MSRIYIGQTKIRINLIVGFDLTGVNTAEIRFRKPNAKTGKWSATLDGDNESIYYDVQSTDEVDMAGTWTFWAYLLYNDGREAYGDPDSYLVLPEGKSQ